MSNTFAHRLKSISLTVLAGAAAMTTIAAPAAAQPTLSKVFTPSTIGPGSVSTITFTITDGSGSPVTGLAFTDVLPAAVTIADPAVASTTCGIASTLDAPDGGTTITFSDGQVAAFGSCTITVDVTSSTPGMHTNPAVTLSSSAGSSMSLPVDLTVDTGRPGFTKSFSPSSIDLGERSTLTITIDNTTNASPATTLSFVDNLPVGLVVADPAQASTDCGTAPVAPTFFADGGTISLSYFGTLTFPAVAAGATCTVTVDVVATSGGPLDNVSGDLSARVGFSTLSCGKASDTLDVTVADLHLTKELTDDPVTPGAMATLEFTILNRDRNFSADGVAFTDDLTTVLAGLTFDSVDSNSCGGSVSGIGGTAIGLSGASVPPEASCTLRVILSVPPGAAPGAYANTTSAVTATVDGSPVVGNMATDFLFVSPTPVITKSFLDDPVEPGDTVVVEFTVTNTSSTSIATGVAFSDPFPTVLPTAAATPGNGCCGAGSTCTFTPLNNPPPPSDVTPAQITVSGGTLQPAGMAGDSCTFQVTLDVDPGAAAGLYLNTTSEVTATIGGETVTGPPATDTLEIVAAPTLQKAFTDDPVAPGGTVTLEFTLTQPAEAPGTATGITFTDDLAAALAGLTANLPPTPDPPCGAGSSLTGSAGDTLLTLMGGTLAPGEECTFSFTLDVPAGATPGTYTNTTSGAAATVLGQPVTSAAVSDDLTVAGLTLTKEFLGDPALPGETVALRFTFENVSPTDGATNIAFSDNLALVLPGTPDLTTSLPATTDTCLGTPSVLGGGTNFQYSGGSVTSGMTCTIELAVAIPAAAADGTYGNTTSSFTTQIGGSPYTGPPATDLLTIDSNLLQITKAFTDDPVAPGDFVTLELTLTNLDAGQAASAIAFSDDLGAALTGLTFVSIVNDTCTATVAGTGTDMIMVSGVSLAAGGSCTLQLSLSVPGGTAAGTYVNTTSTVTGMIGGFAVSGTPAMAFLEVLQLLEFSKSFDGPTTATGTATLTFTITNPGTDTVTEISFTDDLNAVIPGLIATSLPALPCGMGSSLTGISLLSFSGGELPPMGGTCSFEVDVLVPMTATAGTFPNVTGDLFVSGLKVSDPATADLVIEPPPTFAKSFAPNAIGLGQSSVLTFTVDNGASSLAADDLAFTDNLPAGVLVATPSATSNTCGGTLAATAGAGVITLTGGSVGAGASCTITVAVTGVLPGVHVNTTGDLTSSSGNSGPASDTLTVPSPPPGFAKSFSPDTIAVGEVSLLTLAIDNSAAIVAAAGLAFTDNLPAGLVVATPANLVNGCGGTAVAVAGTGAVSLAGGTVAAGATCTITVEVTSAMAGDYLNTTGDLTSSLGNSGPASDSLRVNPAKGFTKSFAPDPIAVGGVSTLTFEIDNSASTADATGLAFTDNLPAGVLVATPANVVDGCGGTVTATAGTGVISLSGGTVAATSICTVSVDVTSSVAGSHVNVSGDLTSSNGNSGSATDVLTVNPPPGFAKSFAPNPIGAGGVSTLTFAIDDTASTADATGLAFTDNLPAGMVVATPANVVDGCGGTVTATSGTAVVSFSGGTVTAGATCTIAVGVTAATPGSYVNVSGALTSSLGDSGTASDTLKVLEGELTIAKTFQSVPFQGGGPAVLRGGFVLVEYTISNASPLFTATAITFSDDLGAALPGLAALGLPVPNVCGAGSVFGGTSVLTLTGGMLAPSTSCTFSATLQVPAGAALGLVTSTSGQVSGDFSGVTVVGSPASADFEVAFVDFVKEFGDDAMTGGLVTLTFTLTNPDPANAITDLVFTDDLDAVLPGLVAVGLPQNDVCGTGSVLTGTSLIALTGGSLGPGESCSFTVDVLIPTTVGGEFDNVTSVLEGTVNGLVVVGDSAGAAMDALVVEGSPIDIPTLTGWGLLVLSALLAGLGVRRMRRR